MSTFLKYRPCNLETIHFQRTVTPLKDAICAWGLIHSSRFWKNCHSQVTHSQILVVHYYNIPLRLWTFTLHSSTGPLLHLIDIEVAYLSMVFLLRCEAPNYCRSWKQACTRYRFTKWCISISLGYMSQMAMKDLGKLFSTPSLVEWKIMQRYWRPIDWSWDLLNLLISIDWQNWKILGSG